MAYDWDRIEHEYVTGKGTMEALARKYGIKLSSFYRRAEVRKFAEKREKYANQVREKALTRAREREIRTLTNLGSALDKAAKKLNTYIGDEDTLHGKVVNHMDGSIEEIRTKKLDTKAVRDLTAAMKEVAAALKLITPDEQRGEENQGGVIILAQREDEEP